MNQAVLDSTREVGGSVRNGLRSPKSELRSGRVQTGVEREREI